MRPLSEWLLNQQIGYIVENLNNYENMLVLLKHKILRILQSSSLEHQGLVEVEGPVC